MRACAGRGIIPAPRLEGRTGYYSSVHVRTLRLVRQLLDRGYTLAAVEKALAGETGGATTHTLDLLDVLGSPLAIEEEPAVMSHDAIAAMARIESADQVVDRLVEPGLAEHPGADRTTVLRPSVVRAGASAITLGLAPDTVLGLLPVLTEHVGQVAASFVSRVREGIGYFKWAVMNEATCPPTCRFGTQPLR